MRDAENSFEPYRPYLRGLAYRMLGSVSDAEDVVQDAFLRWSAADREGVLEPRAFLTHIAAIYIVRNPDKLRHLQPTPGQKQS